MDAPDSYRNQTMVYITSMFNTHKFSLQRDSTSAIKPTFSSFSIRNTRLLHAQSLFTNRSVEGLRIFGTVGRPYTFSRWSSTSSDCVPGFNPLVEAKVSDILRRKMV